MNYNKKLIFILIFILFGFSLLIGYLFINDIVEINVLKNEVNKLGELDLMKDNYSKKIKTSNNCGVIEKKIKYYLISYSDGVKEVKKISNDDYLRKILSIENYKEDGPEFTNSINYIKDTKKTINSKISKLRTYSSDKKIMENISDTDLEDYYVSLYKEFMTQGKVKDNLVSSNRKLDKFELKINNLLDTSLEVIMFLKDNQSNWKIEDDQIWFQSTQLYDKYNSLVEKISK